MKRLLHSYDHDVCDGIKAQISVLIDSVGTIYIIYKESLSKFYVHSKIDIIVVSNLDCLIIVQNYSLHYLNDVFYFVPLSTCCV